MPESPFLRWHPSSDAARQLDANQGELSKLIEVNPQIGIQRLTTEYHFGSESELWDDYIFNQCIRPVLEKNLQDSLKNPINRFSIIDHSLFLNYIRREEDPSRFRRAFWHVNSYGLRLAERFSKQHLQDYGHQEIQLKYNQGKKYKIAFVLKGPFKLAHCEFLASFLKGTRHFSDLVEVFLILVDDNKEAVGIANVNIISLAGSSATFSKLVHYYRICKYYQFDNICWVACVQNLSLYMGAQLAPAQSYWSMKYHSIIMPTIQKYAGLGFGGDSFLYDDVEWYRGRAFPELNMKPIDESQKRNLLRTKKIAVDSLVIGCFVRSEKLHSSDYWNAIIELLSTSARVHFVMASQDIPRSALEILNTSICKDRFHHLGWVNTKEWAYVLDLYFDSSPRGSCNTIFEAIEAGVPILMSDSEHNRESSALPYLQSAAGSGNEVPGVYADLKKRVESAKKLLIDPDARQTIAADQKRLLTALQGSSHLFAKDYLNYFTDKKMTLKRAA